MPWLQLTLECGQDQAAAAEAALDRLGAISVTLSDAADEPLLEPAPGETLLWNRLRVTGLFEADADETRLRLELRRSLHLSDPANVRAEIIQDQDWERVWLRDFKPMSFGSRLWVCPGGQRSLCPDDAIVLELDPGLAFGTGSHPTTALCLDWLASADLRDRRVIDYGCGSGILSVAALALGADEVIAVDHDPQALTATRDNALKNHCQMRLRVVSPDQTPDVKADVLVANILAGTLIDLAETLAGLVKSGGRIGLSGILTEQATAVRACYQRFFELNTPRLQGDWVLLEGIRTDHPAGHGKGAT